MLRNTRQRTAIRQVIEEAEHPIDSRKILEEASRVVPGIGIATVYRAIKEMLENLEIVKVEIPGAPLHYEIAGKGHHHYFRCETCGLVVEIAGCVTTFEKMVPKGFHMQRHDVILYGMCSDCSKKHR